MRTVYEKRKFNEATGGRTVYATVISEEPEEELEKSMRMWVGKWIERRDSSGSTNGLLEELKFDDHQRILRNTKNARKPF